LKVLLIEDNPDHAFFERQALERELDATVTAELRPDDGLRRLRDADFDVVVLDYHLPGEDGLDVLRRIKAARSDLPVVLITAAGNEEVAVAAMKEGASDYLVKRFGSSTDELKLAAAVRRSLEQAELARAYRRSQDILQKTLELAWDGVAYVNLDTDEIVFANEALRHMGIGAAPGALVGKPVTVLFASEDHARVKEVLGRLRSGAAPRAPRTHEPYEELELQLESSDGKSLLADVRAVAVDLEGEPCAMLKIRDITEKKRLGEQLVQAQKMEAIGTLAGGIAHDFNNLLGAILGYASFLKRYVKPEDRLFKSVVTIEAAAERAAELVQRLLSFSRRGPEEPIPFNVNATIEETIRLLSRSIPESITIERRLGHDAEAVEGDETEIQQALLNVCLNARDAMPHGGTLEIATATASEADLALVGLGPRPGEANGSRRAYLMITVRDTGVGIPPEVRPRIFEPFFTTKARGKGTGLGLATAYAIVKAHGGAIDVSSEQGRGTAVRIFVPLSAKASRPRRVEPVVERERHARILVVDDEPAIRDLTSDILSELGYDVVLASSGQEALEKYDARSTDLVVLDIIMPGMNGLETFRRLRQVDPGARVLLSSGYSPEGTASEALENGALGFVQKPYRVADLSKAVQVALRVKKD
jgi:PAS domain S-box-containing protein